MIEPGERRADAGMEKVPFEPGLERNVLGVRDRERLG